MSAGEIAVSDDPRAQKIYTGFRMSDSPSLCRPVMMGGMGLIASRRVWTRPGAPACAAPASALRADRGRAGCSDAMNMRDATNGDLVWESDSVWCAHCASCGGTPAARPLLRLRNTPTAERRAGLGCHAAGTTPTCRTRWKVRRPDC